MMNINELNTRFASIATDLGASIQTYLASCPCDEDTKYALDEISHRYFEALALTQNAIIDYLEKK